jgi:hypothetical protein
MYSHSKSPVTSAEMQKNIVVNRFNELQSAGFTEIATNEVFCSILGYREIIEPTPCLPRKINAKLHVCLFGRELINWKRTSSGYQNDRCRDRNQILKSNKGEQQMCVTYIRLIFCPQSELNSPRKGLLNGK